MRVGRGRGWALAACVGLGAACSPSDSDGFLLDAAASHTMSDQVPTVANVTWDIQDSGVARSWVEFGEDASFELSTPKVDGGTGERLLLGLPGNADVSYRVVAEVAGEQRVGEVQTLETGSGPPNELPSLDAQLEQESDGLGGYALLSILMADRGYPVVVDGDGDYVWWWERPDTDWDTVHVPRVYLSRDGESVVYLAVNALRGGDGMLVRVSLDGEELAAFSVKDAHHDFVELPDGTLAVLVDDPRTVDGELVSGDTIVEIEPDGTTTVVWNAWDAMEYDPDVVVDDGTGWTHGNALDYDDEEDCYYISLRNLDSIHKISRGGETLWRLGGDDSDFALADGSTDLFESQHQFEVLDDGVLVFSNNSPATAYSEVYEYTLDWETGLAELVWDHRHDPDFYTLAFGAVDRLPTGNTLVTWTSSGLAEVLDEDGEQVWSLQAALGGGLSYMHWTPDLYAFPSE